MEPEFAVGRIGAVGITLGMNEGRLIGHIRCADLDSHIHGDILLGVNLTILNFVGFRGIGHVQGRILASHGFAGILGGSVFPLGGSQIAAVIRRSGIAVVHGAVLVGQLRLEYVDSGRGITSLFYCLGSLVAGRIRRLRTNLSRDGIGGILREVVQIRNGVSILVLDLNGNIHIFCLPVFKTVVVLGQIQRDIAAFHSRTGLDLLCGQVAQ